MREQKLSPEPIEEHFTRVSHKQLRATVFCGASSGNSRIATDHAEDLGRQLAVRNIELVYGGASTGLMGTIADTALKHNGHVRGVIPYAIKDHEVAHNGLTHLHVTNGMHERKAFMAELGDIFIALPGGFGTADELFEILTWKQLGFHDKPIGLLNSGGMYNNLINWMHDSVANGYVHQHFVDKLYIDESVTGLLGQLLNAPKSQTSLFDLESKG